MFMKFKRGRKKLINNHFVQGQGNSPSCQKYINTPSSGPQISDTLVNFPVPAQDAVLSKFVGPVGQSDISYECPTKNVRVPDQISDRKYKNIHLEDEKKQNTSDHKGQQLIFMLSCCFCRH